MLQRIQSVYLLLVIICGIVMSFFPLLHLLVEDGSYQLSIIQTSFVSKARSEVLHFNYPLIILSFLIVFFSAITIFRYHNRKMQIKLINYVLLLILLFIGVLFYDYRQLMSLSGVANVSFNYTLIFVPTIIVLLFMARINIKKDEDLVRSADRLR